MVAQPQNFALKNDKYSSITILILDQCETIFSGHIFAPCCKKLRNDL